MYLPQEVLDLGGGVHGDHPHPTAGAVLTGLSKLDYQSLSLKFS